MRMQENVDRLLLLSAVEAKKTLDERRPVDVAELLRRTFGSVESQAACKRRAIEIVVPSEACIDPRDAFLLEKAILNLLQNAIAFTPVDGAIRATVRRGAQHCVILVEDNGPGIPEFAQLRVFERFFSLPRPDTGKKSSGLGLAFVREVAALHRGSVKLRNRPSGGAIAKLRIPAD